MPHPIQFQNHSHRRQEIQEGVLWSSEAGDGSLLVRYHRTRYQTYSETPSSLGNGKRKTNRKEY